MEEAATVCPSRYLSGRRAATLELVKQTVQRLTSDFYSSALFCSHVYTPRVQGIVERNQAGSQQPRRATVPNVGTR